MASSVVLTKEVLAQLLREHKLEGDLDLYDEADFEVSGILGRGGFGVVFKATMPDGQLVALKKLEGEMHQLTPIVDEVRSTLRAARHCASVCRIKGVVCITGHLCLVLKLYRTSLAHALLDYPQGYPLAKGVQICILMAQALSELHDDAKMVHLDLKPANVLMNDDFDVAISDFGLSAMRSSKSFVSSSAGRNVGTMFFTSPEQLDGEGELGRVGTPSDVWSFGIMLVQVFSGTLPYQDLLELSDTVATARLIRRLVLARTPPDIPACIEHPPLRALLTRMLSIQQEDRPSTREVLAELRAIRDQLMPSSGLGASFSNSLGGNNDGDASLRELLEKERREREELERKLAEIKLKEEQLAEAQRRLQELEEEQRKRAAADPKNNLLVPPSPKEASAPPQPKAPQVKRTLAASGSTYCGRKGLYKCPKGTCDGVCGPNNGCQCPACYMEDLRAHRAKLYHPGSGLAIPTVPFGSPVTEDVALPGVQVTRGPNWKWGDQDGGPGGIGVVLADQSTASPGWVRIKWANGTCNSYRIGSHGAFDLSYKGFDDGFVRQLESLRTRNADGISYCGRKGLYKCPKGTCDGVCGPDNGCQCPECYVVDLKAGRARAYHGESVGPAEPNAKIGDPLAPLNAMPGVKVARGKDWKWGDQDGKGMGEVISHQNASEGWVRIRWDKSGATNSYRCGAEGAVDLTYQGYSSPTAIKRVLTASGSTYCGRKGLYTCPKGTCDGVCGPTNGCQCPACYMVDLKAGRAKAYHALCAPAGPGPTAAVGQKVTADIAMPGVRVTRGPDWKWEEQDGGPGQVGVIHADQSTVSKDGWVKVKWATGGKVNIYRIGAEGAYDLALLDYKPVHP